MLIRQASRIMPSLLAVLALAGCAAVQESQETATTRSFAIITAAVEFDEDALGIPHDVFMPTTLVVNKDDTVALAFYNTENASETDEHHTFTMTGTYAVNWDLAPGESENTTFVANEAGVFEFVCTFHGPTMKGQLVVLG